MVAAVLKVERKLIEKVVAVVVLAVLVVIVLVGENVGHILILCRQGNRGENT